jgi:PAS domain S-box-containing protein
MPSEACGSDVFAVEQQSCILNMNPEPKSEPVFIRPGEQPSPDDIQALVRVFEYFNSSTEKLCRAYDELRRQVAELNVELAEKNRELSTNLDEIHTLKLYLDSVVESMASGMIGIDPQERITVFNRSAQQITGYDRDEVIDKRYDEVFPASERQSVLDALRDGVTVHGQEGSLRAKDGSFIPVRYTTALLQGTDNQLLGAMEVFEDLRAIKALEREVQEARTLAALGEMAANVAHEIRNPLGGIGGFAALLERDMGTSDPRQRFVKKIIEGVASLDRIVGDLLIYTRPLQPNIRLVHLQELLNEILSFFRIKAERDGLDVQLKLEAPQEPIYLAVDPDLFQEMLFNLAVNAAQAMPNGGVLRVRVWQEEGTVNLSVEDTGHGMSAETIERLFHPFYTTKTKGTGLGLAIVKKIVEAHGGHVSVQSEESHGTTFRLSFPQP